MAVAGRSDSLETTASQQSHCPTEGMLIPVNLPFIQNLHLKFTKRAEELCLCGQHPLLFPSAQRRAAFLSMAVTSGAGITLHRDHYMAFYITVSLTNGLVSF